MRRHLLSIPALAGFTSRERLLIPRWPRRPSISPSCTISICMLARNPMRHKSESADHPGAHRVWSAGRARRGNARQISPSCGENCLIGAAHSPPIHSSRGTWRQFLLKRRSSGFQSHLINTLSSGVWKHMKGVTGAAPRNGRSSNKAASFPEDLPFLALRGFLVKFDPPFAYPEDSGQLPRIAERATDCNSNFGSEMSVGGCACERRASPSQARS